MSRSDAPPIAAARWWAQRPAREQRLLTLATVLVLGALLWTLGIAPALRTVKAYPAQRGTLDAQLQSMQALQARAQSLQSQPAVDSRAAQAALQNSVASLGVKANLVVVGQQATVTLKGVDAAVLTQWLARARSEARLVPAQAKLSREGSAWSGTLQFNLPGG